MSISVEVWGDYACYSRAEMKVERVSYDVMPPSAARGLLEAIYWHPGMKWVVDRIHVCAPIRFTNIRRNEVKDTLSARKAQTVMEKGGELYLATPDSIQQLSRSTSGFSPWERKRERGRLPESGRCGIIPWNPDKQIVV